MSTAVEEKAGTTITLIGDLRTVGLVLPLGIDYDAWAKEGQILGGMRSASQWAIGDWLVYGEHSYGEKFTQAADATRLNPDSLQVYQWVSSRIPIEIRREDVSHAHHQALARLELEEIQKWLERVAKQGWSVQELRSRLREKRAKAAQRAGDTESAPKFKVAIVFEDDPGEDFIGRLEAYVNREGGTIKSAKW